VRNALMENFRGFNGVMSNVFDAFDRRGPVKYRICRFSRTGVLSSPIFCIQPCSSAPIAVSRTNRNRQVKLPPSTSHQPPINLPSTSHQPPINLPSTCSINLLHQSQSSRSISETWRKPLAVAQPVFVPLAKIQTFTQATNS
jgi:hypothetical protein